MSIRLLFFILSNSFTNYKRYTGLKVFPRCHTVWSQSHDWNQSKQLISCRTDLLLLLPLESRLFSCLFRLFFSHSLWSAGHFFLFLPSISFSLFIQSVFFLTCADFSRMYGEGQQHYRRLLRICFMYALQWIHSNMNRWIEKLLKCGGNWENRRRLREPVQTFNIWKFGWIRERVRNIEKK